MISESHYANRFVQELAVLVEHFAKLGFTVSSLRADYECFGSWVLVAYKNHEAMQFTWDGRDGFITIERSQQTNKNSPSQWKQEITKGLDPRFGESSVSFVENYLRTRFPE